MTGTHTGAGLGDAIRKGVNMVHGTGEAIRGNAMSMVDEASGDKASAVRNQEIANKGVDEWDSGYRGHATSAGTAPATTTSTNYGSHSSNIGNKLDPRFDSDTDHRGTVTGSTNAGPHSTNMGNKLDPRVDSDVDHRADPTSTIGARLRTFAQPTDGTNERDYSWNPSHDAGDTWHVAREYPHPQHEHRGSIGASSGLEAANKLDPVFPVGPDAESMKYAGHSSVHRLRGSISGGSGLQAAQKLDPPAAESERAADEALACGQHDSSHSDSKTADQDNAQNPDNQAHKAEARPQPKRPASEPASKP